MPSVARAARTLSEGENASVEMLFPGMQNSSNPCHTKTVILGEVNRQVKKSKCTSKTFSRLCHMQGSARAVYLESLLVAVLEKHGRVTFYSINFCAC